MVFVMILITYVASYGTKVVHLMHTQGARVVFWRAPTVIKVSIFSLPEIDFKKSINFAAQNKLIWSDLTN